MSPATGVMLIIVVALVAIYMYSEDQQRWSRSSSWSEYDQAARTRLPMPKPFAEQYGNTVVAVPTEEQATEIMAWREWHIELGHEGAVLVSPSYPTIWTGPVLVSDVVPSAANPNGVYAHRTMIEPVYMYSGVVWRRRVIGRVALSGTVLEGERGYRAERATIQELWVCSIPEQLDVAPFVVQCDFEQRYQCPVHLGYPSGAA